MTDNRLSKKTDGVSRPDDSQRLQAQLLTRELVQSVEANDYSTTIDAIRRLDFLSPPSAAGVDSARSSYRIARRQSVVLGGAMVALAIRRSLANTRDTWHDTLNELSVSKQLTQSSLDRLSTAFSPRSFSAISPIPSSKRTSLSEIVEGSPLDHFVRASIAVLEESQWGTAADWHPEKLTGQDLTTTSARSLLALSQAELDQTTRAGELATQLWLSRNPGQDPLQVTPARRWNGWETIRIDAANHVAALNSGVYATTSMRIRFIGQISDAFKELHHYTSGDASMRIQAILDAPHDLAARSNFDRYALNALDLQTRALHGHRARVTRRESLKRGSCPGATHLPSIQRLPEFRTAAEQLVLLTGLIAGATVWNPNSKMVLQSNDTARLPPNTMGLS